MATQDLITRIGELRDSLRKSMSDSVTDVRLNALYQDLEDALQNTQQDQNEDLLRSLIDLFCHLRESSLEGAKLISTEADACKTFEEEACSLKGDFSPEQRRWSERNQPLEASNNELALELKRLQGQLEQTARERDALRAELRGLSKEHALVYKSLVYQLGLATYRQTRDITGWIKIPLAIKRVLRRYAGSGNLGVMEYQPNPSQRIMVAGSSKAVASRQSKRAGFLARSSALLKIFRSGKGESVLWAASKLVGDSGYQAAIRFAEKNADRTQRPAINILRANASLGSEKDWLKYLNAYLKTFGVAPVDLNTSGGSRFLRLKVAAQPASVEGCLVTVIMPAFNAEATLRHAAESILEQTWRNVQLIIVDDCSSDGTLTIAKEIASRDSRVKVLHNPVNVGPYVSKNLALRISDGKYITGHDADDWAHPERLARHMRAIYSDPEAPKASLSGMIRVNELGAVTRFSKLSPNTQDGVLSSAFISCMFEARFLKEVLGSWDEVKFAGDSELIRRAEAILGRPIPRYNFLGMICLDQESSLTNDPEHGHSPVTGVSQSRLAFRKEFIAWHANAAIEELFLPFPQSRRVLELPTTVRVPADSVREVVRYHDDNYGKRKLVCDVCIVTDLRFPGGNASSTLDEVKFFTSKGMTVRLIHCPSPVSQGKEISGRYDQWTDLVDNFHAVTSVNARYLIVRHPTVVCSGGFSLLAPRLKAGAAIVVVNNSVSRVDGKAVYSFQKLVEMVRSLNAGIAKVFPLSPVIRKELKDALSEDLIADTDWSPSFDASQFVFSPRQTLSKPYVVGRHGRDGHEKWIESKKEMNQAYPEDDDFKIRVLGGADNAYKVVGYKPKNWEVFPFGEIPPEKYLAGIDVFVYFPHTQLNEAFGRTIIEAVFVGVPCILPERFSEVFSEMAFYCAPESVRFLVARLAESPKHRLIFVSAVRDIAISKYETSVLAKRLEDVGRGSASLPRLDNVLLQYKRWIETGDGERFE